MPPEAPQRSGAFGASAPVSPRLARLGTALEYRAAKVLRPVRIDPRLIHRRLRPIHDAPADWYDDVYSTSAKYGQTYGDMDYLLVWEAIAARVPEGARVLEVGCGPGHLAHLLTDRGLLGSYVGFDISPVAVKAARHRVPDLRFEVDDAFTTDLFAQPIDLVVCTEVLEHIERDLDVIRRIKPGTPILATVPDFPSATHVRWFVSSRSVRRRYGKVIDDLSVHPCTHEKGWTIYVMSGTVR